MRSALLSTFAVTAALSFAACAAGSLADGAIPTEGPTSNDAGSSTKVADSEDSGSQTVSNPSGSDASQPVTDDDSGANGGSDSGGSASDDAGADGGAVSDDAGSMTTTGTVCPNNTKYAGEWVDAAMNGSTAFCTSGSACTATECCYGPTLPGGGLCVPL